MNDQLVEAGWSDDQWSRITNAVTEEAQRARVAAQMLPVLGPEDRAAVSFSDFRITNPPNPLPVAPFRLDTANVPNHRFTTIAVQVQLRSSEMADPDLQAALVKFRRAANIVARLEDAVAFNDRTAPGRPMAGVAGIPLVDQVTGGGPPLGDPLGFEFGLAPLFNGVAQLTPTAPRNAVIVAGPFPVIPGPLQGQAVAQAVVQAMSVLEAAGQNGPFGCALSSYFYDAVYGVNANFVAAKDRLLPMLNGPLLRASALPNNGLFGPNPYGVVVALGAGQVALRVASDIGVRFLYATEEPRYLFRVSERIGLRVSDPQAIAVLTI